MDVSKESILFVPGAISLKQDSEKIYIYIYNAKSFSYLFAVCCDSKLTQRTNKRTVSFAHIHSLALKNNALTPKPTIHIYDTCHVISTSVLYRCYTCWGGGMCDLMEMKCEAETDISFLLWVGYGVVWV